MLYFLSNQYYVIVIYDVFVMLLVVYIIVLDDDFGFMYNQISYYIELILDYQYFDIDGNVLLIIVKFLRYFENGIKLFIFIKVIDKGNRQLFVMVMVNVVLGISNSFFDDLEIVVWFVVLMILLVILFGVVVIGLYCYCKYGYVFLKRGFCIRYFNCLIYFNLLLKQMIYCYFLY